MMRKLWILIGLMWGLVACGAETAVPKAENITCTVAYRHSVEQGIEREETITFADSDDEQSISFTDRVFHAAYSAGEMDNERTLRVWVTDIDETAVSQSTLYQLPPDSGPQNQFGGGHGFTGLNYSYVPDSTAELQYWCVAN
jgi:hypothetical protein